MSKLDFILEELVTANRILANEGIVDSFGHVSARHPDNPQHYLLSRARAPERIERDDIVEYTLDGTAIDERGRAPYLERFIHGAIYEARPDVHAVVHNHSPSVIPFGVTGTKLKPLLHMCASCGHEVPVWDSQRQVRRYDAVGQRHGDGPRSGEASRLAADGADARPRRHRGRPLGAPRCVHLGLSRSGRQAADAGDGRWARSNFSRAGEVDKIVARVNDYTLNRAWENWARRAGREMQEAKAG